MSTINLLSLPNELLSPIFQYSVEGYSKNLELREVCKKIMKIVDKHIIPSLWKELKEYADSLATIKLSKYINQIETDSIAKECKKLLRMAQKGKSLANLQSYISKVEKTSVFKPSIIAFKILNKKIFLDYEYSYEYIAVLPSEFLKIQTALLDESLVAVWHKVSLYWPEAKELENAREMRRHLAAKDLSVAKELWLQSLNLTVIPQEISSFTRLQCLSLDDNGVANLSALTDLVCLTSFNATTNKICDLKPLSALTQLEYLFLNNNQITKIETLSLLTNLKRLDIALNKITKTKALMYLTNLTRLHLSGNPITNLEAFTCLTNLEWLGLYNTGFASKELLKLSTILNNRTYIDGIPED